MISTAPQREALARDSLRREGFEVFLPYSLERVVDSIGRIYSRRGPLFPSYLFLHCDTADQTYRRAYRQPGVTGMLPSGRPPEPVPPGMVEGIQARCVKALKAKSRVADEDAFDDVILFDDLDIDGKPTFANNQELLVTQGAFRDFHALFKGTVGDRVRVLLSVFGRATETTVPVNCVIAV